MQLLRIGAIALVVLFSCSAGCEDENEELEGYEVQVVRAELATTVDGGFWDPDHSPPDVWAEVRCWQFVDGGPEITTDVNPPLASCPLKCSHASCMDGIRPSLQTERVESFTPVWTERQVLTFEPAHLLLGSNLALTLFDADPEMPPITLLAPQHVSVRTEDIDLRALDVVFPPLVTMIRFTFSRLDGSDGVQVVAFRADVSPAYISPPPDPDGVPKVVVGLTCQGQQHRSEPVESRQALLHATCTMPESTLVSQGFDVFVEEDRTVTALGPFAPISFTYADVEAGQKELLGVGGARKVVLKITKLWSSAGPYL